MKTLQSEKAPGQQNNVAGCATITAVESLMRDHGILGRIIIIYEAALYRLKTNINIPADVMANTAALTREFIQNYHEKIEEFYIFPRFTQNSSFLPLVTALQQQHHAGRTLIDTVLALSRQDFTGNSSIMKHIEQAIRSFERMYGPHSAIEDTVLFPAIHTIFTDGEYLELGNTIIQKENEMFGENGFSAVVDRVSVIEKTLGIENISQFTPQLTT